MSIIIHVIAGMVWPALPKLIIRHGHNLMEMLNEKSAFANFCQSPEITSRVLSVQTGEQFLKCLNLSELGSMNILKPTQVLLLGFEGCQGVVI